MKNLVWCGVCVCILGGFVVFKVKIATPVHHQAVVAQTQSVQIAPHSEPLQTDRQNPPRPKTQPVSEKFQSYFDAISGIDPIEGYDLASLQHFFSQLWVLQDAYFSSQEIEDNFADHRRLGEMVILQTELQASTLSAAERAQIYDVWIAQQPHHFQQVHRDRQALKQLLDVQYMPENIYTDFGPEVVERITTIEAKRVDFRTRFKVFKSEYEALVAMEYVPDVFLQEKQQFLDAHFSPQEQRRVDVFLRHPELIDP